MIKEIFKAVITEGNLKGRSFTIRKDNVDSVRKKNGYHDWGIDYDIYYPCIIVKETYFLVNEEKICDSDLKEPNKVYRPKKKDPNEWMDHWC